jgi:hypothetical protein
LSQVPAKKPAAKKASAKKVAVAKKPAAKKRAPPEPGYARGAGGIYVPKDIVVPVKASKLKAGLVTAKAQLSEMLDDLADFSSDFTLAEIEMQVSFSADGKFLGVGVGGATSITLRLKPRPGADG